MAEQSPQNITVQTNTVIGSQYAQIVGVVVTDIEITLEFVYKNPREEIREAQVVARVTLPREAAMGLAETIFKTKQEHELKKKGKNG
jgi:hypothetical protein